MFPTVLSLKSWFLMLLQFRANSNYYQKMENCSNAAFYYQNGANKQVPGVKVELFQQIPRI